MVQRWIKGNTHTHTKYSDGDSPPEVVVEWYASHGYDFLFLTDHNVLIPDQHLAQLQSYGLPVWQGEEITMAAVHVNGLGLRSVIMPSQPGRSAAEPEVKEGKAERLRWAVEQVRAQGAVSTVNHPNFLWTLSSDDLLAGGEFGLLEVANGHNAVRNEGDEEHDSTECMWDRLLSEGRRVWGVASDDAHYFQQWGANFSNPGRGWLRVDAARGDIAGCLQALREGRFYSSSGLELADLRVNGAEIAVDLPGESARIELLGPGLTVLDAVDGGSARFQIGRFGGGFVRVRGTASDGRQFWTQPSWP
ncbi:MAG: CehA/McbA family metallohydrolase [Chloroflexota bacterium]